MKTVQIKPKLWEQSILVSSESDLEQLNVEPGTVAYTAGMKYMWQLDAEGTWHAIGEEDE